MFLFHSGLEPESRIGCLLLNNSFIIMTTLIYKIPPNLPLPKGGFSPLFGKEGCGEIFGENVNSIKRPLVMIYWIIAGVYPWIAAFAGMTKGAGMAVTIIFL
jgi:hypothetical protein